VIKHLLVLDHSRHKCFFPVSNITCFTFYIHLWPIYRLFLVCQVIGMWKTTTYNIKYVLRSCAIPSVSEYLFRNANTRWMDGWLVGWLGGWLVRSFVYSYCYNLEHRASVKRFVSLQFLNPRHSVGLLARVISPSQGRYLTRTQNKHRHPCLEWNWNARSQLSCERRQFMP
jgi:hypothetical protein